MVAYVSREQWGAKHSAGAQLRGPLAEVVIHTEAVRRSVQNHDVELAAIRAVERYHVETAGFRGIGYSWCIFPSGVIFEGRGWLREGAHTEQGRNRSAHGICFMGHGDLDAATEAQWEAARFLIAEGIRVGAVTPSPKISGHRDYTAKGKSCPGDLIYPHLHRLRGITGQEDDDMPSEAYFDAWFERLEKVVKGQTGHLYQQANTQHGAAMNTASRIEHLVSADGALLVRIQQALEESGRLHAQHGGILDRLLTAVAAHDPTADPSAATMVLDPVRPEQP